MEKLIELLNEYKPQVHYLDKPKREYRDGNFYWYKRENDIGGCISEVNLISKPYGFIKWLVDNDKIDFKDQAMQYAKSVLSKFFIEWEDINGMSDDYVMILMLLSIQDNPIECLVSILK